MLFKLKDKEDVFETNPELGAVEEFAILTDRQMRYIILTYDYKSPLRAMKLEERKIKAATMAGYKYEKGGSRLDSNGRAVTGGKVRNIEKAIPVFKELQRDEDRETLQAIDAQIEQIRRLARDPSKTPIDLKKSVDLSKEIPRLLEIKKEIAHILEIRDEMIEQEDTDLVDEEELSTLDRLNAKL